MPSWPLSLLKEWAKSRPPGYLADLLARARVEGETVILSDADHAALAARYRPPSAPNRIRNAARAVARFTASGFRKVTDPTLSLRKNLCRACPEWDAEGYAGLGRCRKCGCSGIKLTWATEQCPLGKWGRESERETG